MEDIIKRRINHFLKKVGKPFPFYRNSKDCNQTLIYQFNEKDEITCLTLFTLLNTFEELSSEWLFRGQGAMILKDHSIDRSPGDFNIVGNSNVKEIIQNISLKVHVDSERSNRVWTRDHKRSLKTYTNHKSTD